MLDKQNMAKLATLRKNLIDNKYPDFKSVGGRHVDVSRLIRDDPNAPIGLVVRMTTDGDDPLPVGRVRVYMTDAPIYDADGAIVRKKRSKRAENDSAVRAVMSAFGYTGPMTKEMRATCLFYLELEKGKVRATAKAA